MNSFVPDESYISLADTQWAIAGKVPVEALIAARGQLPTFLRAGGSRIVSGNDGMNVLLVFGGPACEGEYLASTLSEEHRTPVYLLNFHEYLATVRRFDGARGEWQEGHPATFLRSYGITPPGDEPLERPVIAIGVMEGVTLDQVCSTLPEARALFTANSRGVLVRDVSGLITGILSTTLKCRNYMLFFNQDDESFLCTISEPRWSSMGELSGGLSGGLSLEGWQTGNCWVVDSIDGETTIDGILRVLDIPRRMVLWN